MSTIFPKWMNALPTAGAIGALGAACTVVGCVWYYFTPAFWEVGYMPPQPALEASYREQLRLEGKPVPGEDYPGFSHQIHAGKLGMDCRYCHTNVEKAAEANIPAASTCIGCHAEGSVSDLYAPLARTQFVRDAWTANESIEFVRVHKLPDYVRNFPHHVHVTAGVSCYSCHGNIMEQPVVHQVEPISMSFCLDCHRDPTPSLVPPDKVTDLYWVRQQLESDTQKEQGKALLKKLEEERPLHVLPENCGACHY